MATLIINGIPHFLEWVTATGQPPQAQEIGRKPVMVFVHGWGGSARYWRPVAAALTSTFDCLLYDLRGFGRTAKLIRPDQLDHDAEQELDVTKLDGSRPNYNNPLDTVYQMGSYAQDLAALLAQLDLRDVTLMAHSMGASIATLMAGLQDSDRRVKRLVLTCSGIFTYNRLSFQAFHVLGGAITSIRPGWLRRVPGMDRIFTARFLSKGIPAEQRQELLEDYLMGDAVAVEGTIYTAVSVQATQEMPQALQSLQIPTLLIAGEYDQIIPTRLAEKAVAQNPEQICYVEMPGVGHFPMLEDPEGYLEVLGAFLQRESMDWDPPSQQPDQGMELEEEDSQVIY
ncbi:MAG: alpha/beta hydrolase [Synechococcaceae cyanobacterium RM1_1_27]|nr:alpha/beta hydrolase [Synechococcaceae cyanobacterium SM2_3_2]NJO85588.1 alpha/beta hydrolase [Synechococcaceae cyanobacterium RM1_1_27]